MSVLFLLFLVVWTLQSMHQNKKDNYIQELCTQAESDIQQEKFELGFHCYRTAIQFYMQRKLDNSDMLCDIWTQLAGAYYIQWLRCKSMEGFSGASDYLKKAMYYNYAPALELFGVLSMECGNFQEAIMYLDKAAQNGRNTALNYRRIGLCYNQIEDDQKAMSFLGQAYLLGDVESFKLLQQF